jgi:hypothetical protein
MKLPSVTALLAIVTLSAGCNKKAATQPNYDNAINTYYVAHPVCLWSSEKQFPVQSAPEDAKTEGYDALVDAGLLTRTTTEKKIIIISKRENNYDLSANGRNAWTADPNQPGYGNFCFGNRTVTAIDSASPNSGQPGATATVHYHYVISGQPAWATAQETQTAFPKVEIGTNTPLAATATLTDTANGWQVTAAPNRDDSTPATAADGKIVQ